MAVTRKAIDEVKQSVREEMSTLLEGLEPAEQLEILLQKASTVSLEATAKDHLRQFVWGIHTLLHHQKYGGLRSGQLRKVTVLSTRILQLLRIQPKVSAVSFLYRDLHLVLAAIHHSDGKILKALWEQQIAYHLGPLDVKEEKVSLLLQLAVQAHRLGEMGIALSYIEDALRDNSDPKLRIRILLEKLKILRLSGDWEAIPAIEDQIFEKNDFSSYDEQEVKWERACREAIDSLSLNPLEALFRDPQAFQDSSFSLEYFFWTRSSSDPQWIKTYPKLRQFEKGDKFKLSESGYFYRAAIALAQVGRSRSNVVVDLEKLKDVVWQLNRLPTLDKELLVHSAIVRWLHQNGFIELGNILLQRYRSKCFQVSSGKNRDLFGFFKDLGEEFESLPSNSLRKVI